MVFLDFTDMYNNLNPQSEEVRIDKDVMQLTRDGCQLHSFGVGFFVRIRTDAFQTTDT